MIRTVTITLTLLLSWVQVLAADALPEVSVPPPQARPEPTSPPPAGVTETVVPDETVAPDDAIIPGKTITPHEIVSLDAVTAPKVSSPVTPILTGTKPAQAGKMKGHEDTEPVASVAQQTKSAPVHDETQTDTSPIHRQPPIDRQADKGAVTSTVTRPTQSRKVGKDSKSAAFARQQTEHGPTPDKVQTGALLVHDHTPGVEPVKEQADAGAENKARYQQALRSMQMGDYAIAYCVWKPLADAGHAQAQFSLGWMYHNGYGLSINNRKALRWWKKAADQGMVSAAFALGLLLSNGDQNIQKDLSQATHYFLKAAALGHADARMMLAHLIVDRPKTMQGITSQWQAAQWMLAGKPLLIRVKRANVRSKPGLDNPIVTVLDQGATLIQLAHHYRWLQVAIPERGMLGWVYDSLVTDADSASAPSGLY